MGSRKKQPERIIEQGKSVYNGKDPGLRRAAISVNNQAC
jgi:hypothetical protein